MSDTMTKTITFGWAAPPIIEQFPQIPADKAQAFDEDNKALIRLHVRGVITDSQRDAGTKKLTRAIARALATEEPHHD